MRAAVCVLALLFSLLFLQVTFATNDYTIPLLLGGLCGALSLALALSLRRDGAGPRRWLWTGAAVISALNLAMTAPRYLHVLRARSDKASDANCTRERAAEVIWSACSRHDHHFMGALEVRGPLTWAQLVADEPWLPMSVGDKVLAERVYDLHPAPGVFVVGGPTVLVDADSCSVVYFAPGK